MPLSEIKTHRRELLTRNKIFHGGATYTSNSGVVRYQISATLQRKRCTTMEKLEPRIGKVVKI